MAMPKTEAEVPKSGTSVSTSKRYSTYTHITNTQSSIVQDSEGPPERSLIFEDPHLKVRFVQVPQVVLRDKRLSSTDKVLYSLLLMYAWQDHECFPGHDRLCDDMDCNRKTVMAALKHLSEAKLIRIKRRGLGKTNLYGIRRLSDGYPRFSDRGARG